MLTVCTFKWRREGYRSQFTADHVNRLRAMFARHLRLPHRFVCVTDDTAGLDRRVEAVPLWPDHAEVPNPTGAHLPSCYRRLKLFSHEARALVGERIWLIDLDVVLTRDVTPLADRPEDVVLLPTPDPRVPYNGSLVLLTPGARSFVWDDFDPRISPKKTHDAGLHGSDQGWMSYCLRGRGEAEWKIGPGGDGIYFYRRHIRPSGGALPEDARIVSFNGGTDPWSPEAQRLAWVQAHYR